MNSEPRLSGHPDRGRRWPQGVDRSRGHFPSDEAAIKLLWLALRNVLTRSVRTTYDWKSAMNQFAILYGERFTAARG